MLRVLFESAEFRSRDAFQAKVKTPLEFVVSALRATGDLLTPGDVRVFKVLQELGSRSTNASRPRATRRRRHHNGGYGGTASQFAARLAAELKQAPPGEGMRVRRNILGFEAHPKGIEDFSGKLPAPRERWLLLVGRPRTSRNNDPGAMTMRNPMQWSQQAILEDVGPGRGGLVLPRR